MFKKKIILLVLFIVVVLTGAVSAVPYGPDVVNGTFQANFIASFYTPAIEPAVMFIIGFWLVAIGSAKNKFKRK